MATVPLSGSDIRLLTGVPFSNDYKNTRWFDTITDQTNYFLAKSVVHTIANANFVRIEGKNFVSVNENIDALWGTNYMMFRNTSYNSKWFYAFVTKLEYKNKGTTLVYFDIDVFQTWKFEMDFKPSFVVREHCPLWNSDGTPIINTVDEGLNYGAEYSTVDVDRFQPYENTFFLVIVSKKTMHGGSANTPTITPMLNGSPQPLTFYVHPFELDGTSPTSTVDGMNINLSPITDVLTSLYKQDDAVNNIVSLYVTDYIGIAIDTTGGTLNFNSSVLEHATIQDSTDTFNTLYLKNLPSYDTLTKSMGSKWSGYKTVTESKLLMHPYTQLILDDFKGNRVNIKPEYISGSNLNITAKGSLGTSNLVSYGVQEYNNPSSIMSDIMMDESALINNTPNDIPVITDLLSAYLQGNRNSLQNQKSSIIFNAEMNNARNFVNGVPDAMRGNLVGTSNHAMNIMQGTQNAIFDIQSIEAKQKDIANTPPSIAKMGTNSYYSFGNGYGGLYIIKKHIKDEYINKLTDFFNMFGYKLNEVKIPNFHTRRYWNFVQTKNCMIIASINNEDLQELKTIFDSGITFWHTDDVGNYSLDNEVL